MNNKNLLLLKTLLKSTSTFNYMKYSNDKKRRSRVVANIVGYTIIYIFIIVYSILMCIGYGGMGLEDSIPATCALSISALAFVFTLLKTNGYLFNFKEYDMLMALPFEVSYIAKAKFMYMYVKSLSWYISIAVAMMTGYGIFAHPSVIVYPLWIILSLLLPVIAMLGAAFVGFVFAKIGACFKKTNIVQSILMFAFLILCFSFRFIVDAVIRDNAMQDVIESISGMTESVGRKYWPVGWFSNAILKHSISDILLLISATLILYELVFMLVAKSYRQINSALKSHAVSKDFRMGKQTRRTVAQAVAHKEFKRFTGSTIYLVNAGMGEVLALILAIASLIIGFDHLIGIITNEAPFDAAIVYPAIPLIVYFVVGMMATTACSPSLEGKNYWIIKSLPINMKDVYKGKMLFNMYLTVPCMSLAIICLAVSSRVTVIETIVFLIEGIALCAFSTTWGCVCGVKHMKLDWENEVEVVKQGTAVAVYLLPNLFVTMALIVLVIFAGMYFDIFVISLIITIIAAMLAMLSYMRVMKLATK